MYSLWIYIYIYNIHYILQYYNILYMYIYIYILYVIIDHQIIQGSIVASTFFRFQGLDGVVPNSSTHLCWPMSKRSLYGCWRLEDKQQRPRHCVVENQLDLRCFSSYLMFVMVRYQFSQCRACNYVSLIYPCYMYCICTIEIYEIFSLICCAIYCN